MFKKLFTLLCLTLLVTSAHAGADKECKTILSDNFQKDSVAYDINSDDLEGTNFGNDHLAFSIKSIRFLIKDLGCTKKSINFGHGPHGKSRSLCKTIVPNKVQSRVCYVESNLGYFLVSRDYQTTINIIFNRWD